MSKIEFDSSQDKNGNGIIEDDELTPEQLEYKKKLKIMNKKCHHLTTSSIRYNVKRI